ncbi:hypothetical protein HDE_01418 [Halotydeus destructor]|nr:hypothetical protein HDE_01418 [Halotydeus destructor]
MVRESSMLKPMEAEAVAIVADSIKSHAHWDAVAMTVRDHFDSKFGKQWQVIIGTLEQAKATSVVHLDHDYLQLSIGKTDLLLFRNKDVDKEIQLNHQLMQAQDRVAILTKNYDLSRKELCQRMTKLKTTLDEKTKMADECHLHMVTTNEQLRRVQEQLEMDKRTRKMAEGKRVADLEAEKYLELEVAEQSCFVTSRTVLTFEKNAMESTPSPSSAFKCVRITLICLIVFNVFLLIGVMTIFDELFQWPETEDTPYIKVAIYGFYVIYILVMISGIYSTWTANYKMAVSFSIFMTLVTLVTMSHVSVVVVGFLTIISWWYVLLLKSDQ